jgi:hypothetical protein
MLGKRILLKKDAEDISVSPSIGRFIGKNGRRALGSAPLIQLETRRNER